MNKKVELSDDQIELVRAAIENNQSKLAEEVEAAKRKLELLQKRFDENKNVIRQLKVDAVNGHEPPSYETIKDRNGYPLNESWWDKISYLLKKENRPLTSKEIISMAIGSEPDLNGATKEPMERAKINIYTTLHGKSKSQHLVRQKGKNDTEYKYTLKS